MRVLSGVAAAAMLALCQIAARAAPVTVDQARTMVSAVAGRAIDGVQAKVTQLPSVQVARFAVLSDDGSVREYSVNLTDGKLLGFVVTARPTTAQEAASMEKAMESAKATARAFLDATAADLEWNEEARPESASAYGFVAESSAAPPGASPVGRAWCRVEVDKATGLVLSYLEGRAATPEEGAVVTEAAASANALAAWGKADAEVVGRPKLYERKGHPLWSVELRAPDGSGTMYALDAASGQVMEEEPAASEPRAPQTAAGPGERGGGPADKVGACAGVPMDSCGRKHDSVPRCSRRCRRRQKADQWLSHALRVRGGAPPAPPPPG